MLGKIPAIPTLGAQGVTLRNTVYDLLMKRTSTYVGTIVVCAMVAENTLDSVVDTAWNVNNKGVRRHAAANPRVRVHECCTPARLLACRWYAACRVPRTEWALTGYASAEILHGHPVRHDCCQRGRGRLLILSAVAKRLTVRAVQGGQRTVVALNIACI